MPALSESIASLPPLQRRMAEAWLTRFEENWHDQKLRECMRALPVQSSLRRPLLLAMVERDLAHHWEAGRPLGVESYLKDFPELGPADELPIELIAVEYQLREQHGGADLADFAERFPSRIDDLYLLLKPGLFESGSNPDTPKVDDAAAERRMRLLRSPVNAEPCDAVSERRMHLLRSSAPAADLPTAPAHETVPEIHAADAADLDVFLPPEPARNDPTRKLDVSPARTVWLDVQSIPNPRPTPSRAKSPVPMPPPNLGRYQIDRRLGSSGTGSIYHAVDTELGRRVALKVPQFVGPDADAERSRFHREARAAAGLSHPLLCPVLDVGRAGEFDYLAMPLVEGDTLQELMKQRPIWPVRQAVDLVLKLASALDAAHRQGVVHRHLKPTNVLIAPSETPVIVGFGQWTRPAAEGGANAAYVAPELFSGQDEASGPRIDIFSLGVIFYRALTGQLPPVAPNRNSKLSFPADLDAALRDVCRKAMAADADDRYTTMRQLVDDLTKFRQTLRTSESGTRLSLSSGQRRLPTSSIPGLAGSAQGLPASVLGLSGSVPALPSPPMLGQAPAPSATFTQMQELRTLWGTAVPAVSASITTATVSKARFPKWLIGAGVGAVALFLTMLLLDSLREGKRQPPAPETARQEPVEVPPPPETIDIVLQLLQTSSVIERDTLVERLKRFKGVDSVKAVEQFIATSDWSENLAPKGEIRDAALTALIKMDSLSMPPALIRAAKNADPRVRSWAFREMARKIDADSKHYMQPVLLNGLKDSDPQLRRLIAEQIKQERFNDAEVVHALTARVVDELWGEAGNPRADGGKNAALDALEEYAPERVASALNGALRSGNVDVRKWAERQKKRRDE